MMSNSNEVLTAALDYRARGMSVIWLPRQGKQATSKWKPFQSEAADESQIKRWFSTGQKNVAIVCGSVSNLVVRDFDDHRQYQEWKRRHRDLASTAPTVATAKGFHVYCTMDPIPRLRTSDVAYGELRGTGAYVVAPPSIHPTGVEYSWTNPLDNGIPNVTFSDLDLEPPSTQDYRRGQKRTEEGQKRTEVNRNRSHIVGEESTPKIEQISDFSRIIDLSIPSETGQRERKLFDLARRLKSFDGITLDHQLAVFDQWWERARDIVGTKDYEVSMNAFLRCVENAETPLDDVLGFCLERAKLAPKPAWSMKFNEECQLLAGLCQELQTYNESQGCDHFYLSCRSAGEALEISHNTANIYLALFQRLRKLQIVEHGTTHKATRWRYVG